MDVIKIIPEYLDMGLEPGELESLVETTIEAHLVQLKRAIANSVVSARSFTLMDNLDGSTKALGEARKFKKQYHHFLAELTRLRGSGPELTPEPEPNHVGVLEE
jgi:hypothetical protein|tara:strand:+ start:1158 stop:1469 length:312 start_codon:yes stop_codon:yes gene_type:complete